MRRPTLRVALLCVDPWRLQDCVDTRPFNYAVRRIQAAILGHPALAGVELSLIESTSLDESDILARIEAFDPDVIGASAYVWSFPILLEVCRQARRARPDRTILFGGPSARPELFELPQHADGAGVVDALVVGEGEACIQEILLAPDRSRDTLLGIRGLAVHTGGGWTLTGERDLGPPDIHPSPYQMGLMPQGVTCQIESFRGCPLSCTYCEWGDTGVTSRTFGYEHLVRELASLRTVDAKGTWLVDPGLNLNSRAFQNLRRAEAETGSLREIGDFRCEIYPSRMTDEHLAFLEQVGARYAGIGLQSLDADVLKGVERPFNEDRFNRVVTEVSSIVPDTVVEVIMGLPGDTPESFRRTVERARHLPVALRVFHCLVLPSALMTRAPASFDLKYDPFTLQVISCRGWSRRDIEETCAWLDDAARSEDADIPHGGTWKFPRPGADAHHTRSVEGGPVARTRLVDTAPSVSSPAHETLAPREMHDTLARRVARAAAGWRLDRVVALEGDLRTGVVLFVEGAAGVPSISVTKTRPGVRSFRELHELSYSYASATGDTKPDPATLQALERVIAHVHPIMRAVILGVALGAKPGKRPLPLLEPAVTPGAPSRSDAQR